MMHTKGPWRVDGGGIHVRTAAADGGPRSGQEGGNQLICRVADVFMNRAEREANARLLAAVPDLLAACQAWVKYFDDLNRFSDPDDKLSKLRNEFHGSRVEQTRAAILKTQPTTEAATHADVETHWQQSQTKRALEELENHGR